MNPALAGMPPRILAKTVASPRDTVIVIGAGPIGLLLANLLGSRKVHTYVFDKGNGTLARSMAIGITPPSLEILKRLQLDRVFSAAGVQVRYAEVYESRKSLGRLSFDHIPSRYPYFLSIPQANTIAILRRNLTRFPSVRLYDGMECTGVDQTADSVTVRLRNSETRINHSLIGALVIGCDGHRSIVRESAGLAAREKVYPQRFVMADFADNSGLDAEARLYFSEHGSVESFPLPGGWRRWIVLATGSTTPPLLYLTTTVRQLAGYNLAAQSVRCLSEFGAKRMVVDRYYSGRLVLAGDAAHLMSSIGGQGMNTGFADAEFLGAILPHILANPHRIDDRLSVYDRLRRRAYTVAAARAERGMWLGTRRGRVASHLRRLFIAGVLFKPPCRNRLAPHFAMLTIPFRNLNHVPSHQLTPSLTCALT